MSPDNGGVAVTERLNHLMKVGAESREGTGFGFSRPAYAFQTFYAAFSRSRLCHLAPGDFR
jgi:hypothetical protein